MAQFDLCAHLGRDKKHLFQKCLPLEQIKDTSKLEFPMWASEKFDGVFCCAVRKPDGSIGIFSRTGEEYLSMEHLKPFYERYITDEDFVLFEAYIPNVPQSVISGACRDTKKQHPELLAYQHNAVVDGKSYFMNIHKATLGIGGNCFDMPYVHYIKHIQVNDLQEALKLAEEVWARGGEGIILNDMTEPYQPGKCNASMIKIKKVLSYDLQVVDIFEGKGKYAGTLGGLVCRWKDGKTIKVSGMTDERREQWWKNPELILGKIVEVHAMAESSKGLLREPRFKGIRWDKEEADY